MKKKSVIKLLSLSLCGVLAATSITMFVHAENNTNSSPEEQVPSPVTVVENALSNLSLLTTDGSDDAISKDETVYVLANADGSVQKVIVSDWLKNALGENLIKDVSGLKNIENVKGDETFTSKDSNTLWNSNGKDIYYQGNTDKALPVKVTVTYLLDGEEVTPSELKGKSGHVTIRYNYQNKEYQLMEIDGKEEKIYVPFAMLTGLLLDDEKFTNVEVTGGRLINDGSRTIVAGVAFPGLQENLQLDKEKLEIPDSLEIQADVQNFEMNSAVIIATNEVFNRINLDGVDSMEELQDAMSQLTDAMEQLMDGSSRLTDGLKELLEKSGELSEGVSKLADGSEELTKGAGQLNDGAGQLQNGAVQLQNGASQLQNGATKLQDGATQLQNGASELSSGLNTLVSNNDSLNGGARQVFDTLLATAGAQLSANGLTVPAMTVENYGEVLNGVIASLDSDAVYAKALQTVTDAVNAQSDMITEKVTEAVRTEVVNGVTAVVRANVSAKVQAAAEEQVRQKVEAAVEAQVRGQVEAAVEAQVRGQVEAAVRNTVAEQVIQNATGMDTEGYANAVSAGMIPEENQAAINTAIETQMASETVKSMIDVKTVEQMESESIQNTITAKTAEQMDGETVQNMITAKTAEQMESESVQALITSNTDEQMDTEEVKSIIDANVDAKMAETSIQETIAQNVEAQKQKAINDNMASPAVQEKLEAASEGAKSVISLKASLDNYNAFYHGLQAYTAGVAQAAEGAGKLSDGAGQLSSGAGQLSSGAGQLAGGAGQLSSGAGSLKNGTQKLYDGSQQLSSGLEELKDAMPALLDGVKKLYDGSSALRDGLNEFNEKGIQKLVDAVDGDLEGLVNRLQATTDASKQYRNYSGIADDMDGQVKFIYRVGGVQ